MSFQFPAYASVTPTGDGSSIDSSLLTPPLTPRSEHDTPYKPTKTDKTSLSMRKSRHKAKKSKVTKAHKQRQSTVDVTASCSAEFPTEDIGRGRSSTIPYSGKTLFQPTDDALERARRWTLPSKSSPTRVFTPLGSTVKQATMRNERESPAMITLRRASTSKKPKRVGMTFFPEPKFGNERSNLLSYIVSTFSQPDMLTTLQRTNGNHSQNSTSARSASVGSDGAHPASTLPAATVCTETFVESTLAMPDPDVSKHSRRRCSARYVAGDTSFEVLWDENDGSTTTQDSSRPSVTSDRRPSMAAVKLEAQLASSSHGSRRSSNESRTSSRTNSQGSINMFLERIMTPQKLTSLFPRLLHDTSLRDLPRSRGDCRAGKIYLNTSSDCPATTEDRRRSSALTSDAFPPLPSHRRNSNAKDGFRRRSSTRYADKQPCRRMSAAPSMPAWRTGGMLGSSSHSRRRSSGNVLAKMQRAHGQRCDTNHDNSPKEPRHDTDMTPLLHTDTERGMINVTTEWTTLLLEKSDVIPDEAEYLFIFRSLPLEAFVIE